jgi:GNAT superfamily N-acetyltransferase
MIEVLPAVGRFDDVSAVLRPRTNPDKACWCLTYRLSPTELSNAIPGSRPAAMSELCSRNPGPGLVAYLDGVPAGWCGVGPRSEFHRLTHSRTIQQLDDVAVWSVVCLVVSPGLRGKGIAAAMLDHAVDFARDNGATVLEGYPIDSAGGRVNGAFAFPGSTNLFERAGFTRMAPTASKSGGATRWIMRRSLTP